MTVTAQPLEEQIEVAAAPAQVWALVTDVRRMAEWSPQVVRTTVSGGVVALGTTFRNLNRRGVLRWPTNAEVVRFEPHREFAFRVKENHSVWSFTLEPTATGTRVVQRREVDRGVSKISLFLQRTVLGGVEGFEKELQAGMQQTLERIRAELER